MRDELRRPFHSAQLELTRAGSLPFIISGPAERFGDLAALERLLTLLTAYDNDIRNRSREAREAATHAAGMFSAFSKLPPGRWHRSARRARKRARLLARLGA
jgi:hypothetical protein